MSPETAIEVSTYIFSSDGKLCILGRIPDKQKDPTVSMEKAVSTKLFNHSAN